jgi:hypothetical protein
MSVSASCGVLAAPSGCPEDFDPAATGDGDVFVKSSRNALTKVASKSDVEINSVTLSKDNQIDIYYFMLPDHHPAPGALVLLRQEFTDLDGGERPDEVYLSNQRQDDGDWQRPFREYSNYHLEANTNPSWYRDTFHASYEQDGRLRRSNDTDARAEAFEYRLSRPYPQFLKSRIQTYKGIREDGLCMRFNIIKNLTDARHIEKVSATIASLDSLTADERSRVVDVAEFHLTFE